MDFKKIGKAIIFPHIAIMIILVPISTVFLIYSMVFIGKKSPIAIISYVLSFYTLSVWTVKTPKLISFFKEFKNSNKYVLLLKDDVQLRMNLSLYGGLFWNTAYALLQFALGFRHHTFWYYSLGGYYLCVAIMRFFLVLHTSKYEAGEKMREELIKYRTCGIIFLLMNLALSTIIFFMVYWNRTFVHHEITTIAMAAYTFTSFTIAIINLVKYRKMGSPVYSAAKIISLASASVSMLTLEATMLTTFDDGTMTLLARKILLGISGGAVSAFVIVLAIYMILKSNKNLRSNIWKTLR